MWQMVGRERELGVMENALGAASGGNGSSILVSGEVGVGKTTLVKEFMKRNSGAGIIQLTGNALAEAAQPFQMFQRALAPVIDRPIFEEHEYSTFTELFAIDRAGILVAKAAPEDEGLDADIFAGMFAAVQDFVRDSFDRSGGQGGGLGRLDYGDMKILVEHGQHLLLVAVFRGAEHAEMRKSVKKTLKDIEARYGQVLEGWNGSTEEVGGIADEIASLAGMRFLVRKSLEGLSLEQERTRIADHVLDILEELGREKTVILQLEDLHWADESSLFVMNYLARNIRQIRVLILGTLRPGEGSRALEALEKTIAEGAINKMELGRFGADATISLINGLYPGHRFPGEFVRKLVSQCDGNPFFATEMLRHLETAGSIVQMEGIYHLETQDVALPGTIEEVVHSRVGKLDSESLALVEYASCIGRELDKNILMKFDSAKDPEAALGRLAGFGIIVQTGEGTQFSHALFHSVIYDSLSARWKSHYHRSIGEYYEQTYKNRLDTVMYELARHFSLTQEHAKSFEYCRQAGEKAEGAYSPELVVEYYTKAIAAIPKLKMGDSGAAKRLDLLERTGEVQGLSGQFDESLTNYLRALEEAKDPQTKARLHRKRANVMTWSGKFTEGLKELDEAEKILEGTGHDEMGFLLVARSFINMNTGNFEDTLDLAQKGIDVLKAAQGADARKTVGRAWKIMGVCHMLKGNYDESLRCHTMGKAIGEELNDLYGLSASYNNIGNVYLAKGEFPKALEHYTVALDLLDKTKDLQGMSYTLNNIGIIHKNRGEFDKALEKYRETLRILGKIGDPSGMTSALNNIGNLLSEQGKDEEAIPTYEQALAIAKDIGDKQQYVSNLCAVIPSRVKLGQIDKAGEECAIALDLSREMGSKRTEFWSIRNLGLIAGARRETEPAEKHFTDAEEGFKTIGMEVELAKTFFEHGVLLKEAGRPGAETLLRQALDIFKKSGMDWNAANCERMLDDENAAHP